MMSGSTKVVDSWAMIAWLLDQGAASKVEAIFQDADDGKLQLLMSWINVGEVYYIAAKRYGREKAERFLLRLPSLPIRVVLPDETDIIEAARLKGSHRLAYADAFAAALALREGAAVITGDPELGALKDVLDVDWIGSKR
jgi:predicted nucleic acid-binding protein